MNAYCPECETDLDRSTGICPACRWDPLIATDVRTVKNTRPPEMSLTERYRGTPYDLSLMSEAATTRAAVSRGRVFVLLGLVAAGAVYGIVMSLAAPF
jgi:predicted ATP-dependent serine protease